ncbi:MAG TPA: helix-turn-helix domain-containing protein [Candidatus Absconditabacterales bacterium]|nr:helix-turn-helix domain-containing protein [Candidatus Absconditabacterales bacterium]HNG96637.1 helix-turn-helix domain-containing protein [Candidatus Absconditabacterales bacterium]
MSDLIYNISKEAASQLLGVSTRTIDRYLSNGRLTSKKSGNKVMLAQDEVLELRKEYADIEINDVDIISSSDYHQSYGPGTNNTSLSVGAEQLGKLMDEKFDRFATMLENKDNLLEEKNALIFGLQKKLGEVESTMKSMVALPDHHNEKEQLLAQKKELQNRLDNVHHNLKKEETKNNIFIGLLVIVGILIVMLMFWNPKSSTSRVNSGSGFTTQVVEEVP